jgi:hypothetical protein
MRDLHVPAAVPFLALLVNLGYQVANELKEVRTIITSKTTKEICQSQFVLWTRTFPTHFKSLLYQKLSFFSSFYVTIKKICSNES